MGRVAILGAVAALLVGASAASAARPVREPLHARGGGFLTAPSEHRPVTIALDYVRVHRGAFGLDEGDLAGLTLARAYRFGAGAIHLQWEQSYRGIPVFGPGLRANVDADGRLINVGAGARPDPSVASIEPRLSALDALLAAGRAAGAAVVPGRPSGQGGPERVTDFADGQRASLTVFGERLAWRVLLAADARHFYDAVVDANSGDTLYRVNLVREATALAFDNYPGAPAGGVQTTKTLTETGDDPWLTVADRLAGDNAHVFSDPSDAIDGVPPDPSPAMANEIPPSAVGAWNYPQDARAPTSAGLGQRCPATPGCSWDNFDSTPPNFSWRVNREQAGTQLFYFVNTFHDHLRDAAGIGFDDGSGNFEGSDRVEAQVDDGATTDVGAFDDFPNCAHLANAYVIPVPEGTPLAMQIYLWSNACTTAQLTLNDVNAADDALVVYHEYTHGMTNRLVTDGSGFPGLNGAQPGAMDEGFADWYALDALNGQGFEPDSAAPGELVAGRYEHDALRTQPFDCPVAISSVACPGTPGTGPGGYNYGDFGKVVGAPEVHADGEIWVETLWDLRTRLIADHGALEGIARARALVTDGLRLAPLNPTFLDMRNAILQADLVRGFGDTDRIWAVFAARGMGYRASTSGNNDTAPVADFSLPSPTVPPPPPPPAGDKTRPKVSKLSLSRRRFKVGQGTTFSFRLSEAATARIVIDKPEAGRRVGRRCRPANRSLRKRRRCTRYLHMGTVLKPNLRPGAHRVRFSGRLGSRALRAGVYRATVVATDPGGNRSRAARVAFRVVRG